MIDWRRSRDALIFVWMRVRKYLHVYVSVTQLLKHTHLHTSVTLTYTCKYIRTRIHTNISASLLLRQSIIIYLYFYLILTYFIIFYLCLPNSNSIILICLPLPFSNCIVSALAVRGEKIGVELKADGELFVTQRNFNFCQGAKWYSDMLWYVGCYNVPFYAVLCCIV